MNIEEIRDYCLAKPGVIEGFPFNDTALVFKLAGKMFALAGLEGTPLCINLRCDSAAGGPLNCGSSTRRYSQAGT